MVQVDPLNEIHVPHLKILTDTKPTSSVLTLLKKHCYSESETGFAYCPKFNVLSMSIKHGFRVY